MPRKKASSDAASPVVAPAKPKRSAKDPAPEKKANLAKHVVGKEDHGQSVTVVGVAASAGGLEAFTQLLTYLPTDTGLAYVFIQHLDPTHESMLADILAKSTRMPVIEARNSMSVKANHIYVIPPNTNMGVRQGVLSLLPRSRVIRGQHMPADYFLRSLAEDMKSRAIGIILSGTGSDGTMGLGAIKAEGGLTFAQDEQTAKYDGMPRSAIQAGAVDFVLSPEGMARELMRIGHHPYVAFPPPEKPEDLLERGEDALGKIFLILRGATGVDFTHYKPSTIKRRLARRMVLNRVEKPDDYVRILRDNPGEAEALYQDLLINVTNFYRDPEVFETLKERVYPRLIRKRAPEHTFRVWVPGCSTGEEVYSIAISLLEFLDENSMNIPIQIFGTDISDQSIERARVGMYPASIDADVSVARLRKFFLKTDNGYQISKSIRDLCVFARQDVTKDPPFSNLDLISCRNLLIYMGPVLQRKVIPTFHYGLKPEGVLLLGSSETIGGFADLFKLLDKKNKIYVKKSTTRRQAFDFVSMGGLTLPKRELGKRLGEPPAEGVDVFHEADKMVLAKYAPAGVLVSDSLEILQFRGKTGTYLEPAAGTASLSLLKMAREGLVLELHTLIATARKQDGHVRKSVQFVDKGTTREVTIEVVPIRPTPTAKASFFLILFEEAGTAVRVVPEEPVEAPPVPKRQEQRVIGKLRQELAAAREYLQTTVEEQEATNEELRAAIEEIQSSNEELQSTNEELETAKEELQSTNEELITVNEELQNRNAELGQANNDLYNLLSSVNIAIVMLASDLTIRRFTPMAEKVLNLIPSDVGRPFTDIRTNLSIPELEPLIHEVLDTLATRELEVQDKSGIWYSMRIRAYRTSDNRIEGVVIAFVDIGAVRHSLDQVEEARRFAEAIVETVREPLLVLNGDLRVKTANSSFYRVFQVNPQETEGRPIHALGEGQWAVPKLLELLDEIIARDTEFDELEIEADFPRVGRKRFLLNARRLLQRNEERLILLALEEVAVE